MLSDHVMSQLGELNRRRSVERGDDSAFCTVTDPTLVTGDPNASQPVDQLPTGSESTTGVGSHWLRQIPITDLWQGVEKCLRSWPAMQHDGNRKRPKQSAELDAVQRCFPQSTVFLDLETCGFAGSMVFLIGLIHFRQDQLVLSQLLARHYGEEKPIFHSLCDILSEHDVLVTFNGKSFDWPMAMDRLTLHRMENRVSELSAEWTHCDLLHHARRRWRQKLPDCKLQTLERFLCGRRRVQDIAGREIPEAYHDFVRSGDAWLMRRVLHHNALDLITLIQLSRALVSPVVALS